MKKKAKKWWKAGAFGVVCLAAAYFYYAESGWERRTARPEKEAVFFLENTDFLPEEAGESGDFDAAAGLEPSEIAGESENFGEITDSEATDRLQEQEKTERIWIHVCGQVVSPGVYELAPGSRVYEAIEAAGGLLEEAASDALNMAMELTDGQQLRVPTREEAEAIGAIFDPSSCLGAQSIPGARGSGEGRINLNTAGKEELMQLSGIGEARAEAIVAYRTEHGPFRRIEDIMKVSGIKEAAFEKIRDDITV